MVIGAELRRFRDVANLSLNRINYNNQPIETIPHYYIVANFDHLIDNIALHFFASWDRLFHLLFALCRTALWRKTLLNLLFNQPDWFRRPVRVLTNPYF
jgi:hypothetical protein